LGTHYIYAHVSRSRERCEAEPTCKYFATSERSPPKPEIRLTNLEEKLFGESAAVRSNSHAITPADSTRCRLAREHCRNRDRDILAR
jgi:hypothetical protein